MFITLLSKFEIFIGTLLTTKNNPLTMDYKTLYEAELTKNKILKDKSKGFKTLFREVKKLTKELEELKDEINELNETITRVQKERNYLGDYEGGATSEEEEEEEESSEEEEKLMSPDEYTQDWLETMLFPDDVGDAERFIVGAECQKGYQDILEGDMAHYYDDNRTKMCPKMKAEWREEFPHDDDDKPYFHDDVGVLADVIEDYYLNKLKIPKSKMDEWRDSYEKEMYVETEEDRKEFMKQCGVRI